MALERDVDWRREALRGAKIIDELLALFRLYDEDYNITRDARRFVALMAREPDQSLTLLLARYFDAHPEALL